MAAQVTVMKPEFWSVVLWNTILSWSSIFFFFFFLFCQEAGIE